MGSPLDGHDLFEQLVRESIYADGPELSAIAATCKENKIHAVVGFNERSRASIGCLWNSYLFIDDEGKVLNHHRKIAPTFTEKVSLNLVIECKFARLELRFRYCGSARLVPGRRCGTQSDRHQDRQNRGTYMRRERECPSSFCFDGPRQVSACDDQSLSVCSYNGASDY